MNKISLLMQNLTNDPTNLTEITSPKVLLTEEKLLDKLVDMNIDRKLLYTKQGLKNRGYAYVAWIGGDRFVVGFRYYNDHEIHWMYHNSTMEQAINHFNEWTES